VVGSTPQICYDKRWPLVSVVRGLR
jgi:hypothetical protein